MAFELGFLVGSLALLGLVVYVTRFRGPSLPHERMEGEAGDGQADAAATSSADATRSPPTDSVEVCELCGENPAMRSVNNLDVCPECDDDLLA